MSAYHHATAVAPPATGDRLLAMDIIAWLCATAVLQTFLQAWGAPLTGWAVDAADSALLRNGFFPGYFVLLVLALMAPMASFQAIVKSPLLYGIILLSFVSAFWSIDGEATLRRSVALLFTTLAGTVMAARWGWRGLSELLAAQFTVLAVASFLVALALPRYGVMTELFPGAWRGVWLEKNALGGTMATGAIVCLAAAILSPRRRWLWAIGALLCAALVLFSTSKTALLATALGGAVAVGVWIMRRGPVMAILATWAIVVVVGTVSAVLALAPEMLLDVLGKDSTLTGRTEIWTAAIRQGAQQPVTGFGYGVLWDHQRPFDPGLWISRDAGFVASHAHNGWLEVWLGMGFIGLAAWSLYYLEVLVRVVAAAYRHAGAYLALPFFVIFTLMSITEVSILDYQDPEWLIFVLVATRLTLGDKPEPDPQPAS